mmetsp:Transcript_36810/g.77571  ORF Transcript_36810/g.77571 Transcript_36810/m.77571 type:complete len:86 (-) Transcript_36810:215-472(-)
MGAAEEVYRASSSACPRGRSTDIRCYRCHCERQDNKGSRGQWKQTVEKPALEAYSMLNSEQRQQQWLEEEVKASREQKLAQKVMV